MSTNHVENRPLSLLVQRGDSWLMVRHRRLGVSQWELPGGHLDPGEDAETAAARETREETGARVEIGSLVASCVHEWAQRRQRRVILFFLAHPRDTADVLATTEPGITDIGWRSPRSIPLSDISPLIHPSWPHGPRSPPRDSPRWPTAESTTRMVKAGGGRAWLMKHAGGRTVGVTMYEPVSLPDGRSCTARYGCSWTSRSCPTPGR
jgi:8-oxo-dGTP diphosphatase